MPERGVRTGEECSATPVFVPVDPTAAAVAPVPVPAAAAVLGAGDRDGDGDGERTRIVSGRCWERIWFEFERA